MEKHLTLFKIHIICILLNCILNNVEKPIEKSLYMFKDLDKELFDHNKIKNFD